MLVCMLTCVCANLTTGALLIRPTQEFILAERYLRLALSLRERLHGAHHPLVATSCCDLSNGYVRRYTKLVSPAQPAAEAPGLLAEGISAGPDASAASPSRAGGTVHAKFTAVAPPTVTSPSERTSGARTQPAKPAQQDAQTAPKDLNSPRGDADSRPGSPVLGLEDFDEKAEKEEEEEDSASAVEEIPEPLTKEELIAKAQDMIARGMAVRAALLGEEHPFFARYVFLCVCVCVCVCKYIYTYIHIYIYVRVCINVRAQRTVCCQCLEALSIDAHAILAF
jgi:hypothetical protein